MINKKRGLYTVTALVVLVIIAAVGVNLERFFSLGQSDQNKPQQVSFQREQVLPVIAQGIDSWIATNVEELNVVAEATLMPVPLIDFERSIAIAVGVNQNNAGKSLRIEHVEQKGDQVTVKVTLLTPSLNQTVQSSDLITIQKQDLNLSGVLTFNFIDQAGRELGHRQALIK